MSTDVLKQRFIASYAAALALIVIASAIAHLLTDRALDKEDGMAEIVNVSGAQRMLVQRIYGLVEVLDGERAAERHRVRLGDTIEQLARANGRLRAHVNERVLSPDHRARLEALFDDPTEGINVLLTEFTGLAEQAVDGELTAAQRARLETLALGPLFLQLDRAVDVLEADLDYGLTQIARIQQYHLLAILLVLLGESLFIFTPLLRKTLGALSAEREARLAAQDALRLQGEAVAAKGRFMNVMRTTFLHPLGTALEHLETASEADPDLAPDEILKALTALRYAEIRARQFTTYHEDWVREHGEDEPIPPEPRLPQDLTPSPLRGWPQASPSSAARRVSAS